MSHVYCNTVILYSFGSRDVLPTAESIGEFLNNTLEFTQLN